MVEALDAYRFNEAAGTLYKFVWHEFCDWYLEAVKPTLYGRKGPDRQKAAKRVLGRALRDTLVLLHPFMPFVTEEIWHKLPGTKGSIMETVFPSDNPGAALMVYDEEAESEMNLIISVITGIRKHKREMNIAPSRSLMRRPRPRMRHKETLNRLRKS